MKLLGIGSEMLTQARAQTLFSYDPETGVLTHKIAKRSVDAGSVAGSVYNHGYRVVTADGERYVASRVIWLMQTGAWPKGEIDHFNRERDDNRWANLRDVTRAANQHNHGTSRSNKSGEPGVIWHSRREKWFAYIRTAGRQKSLGYYDVFADAVAARRAGKVLHRA
jgi:hypothetical protein